MSHANSDKLPMLHWILPLLILAFSFSAAATPVECGPQADQFALEPLREFVARSCEDTKASAECQNLYAEIKQNGDNPEDKALQCSDQNVVWRALKKDFDFRVGCAKGGWNFVADTVVSLWEGAKKISTNIEQAKAENAACDKDPEKKKAIYTDYNNSVPKMLQIEVPDEATFQRVECARLKAGARIMQTRQGFFAVDKVRSRISDPNAKYNSEEQEYVNWIGKMKGQGGKFPDIIGLAEAKLKEMGVKLECYSDREVAALTCEAIAEVATLAAGPAGVALKAARVSKIAKLAGVPIKTETAAAGTATRLGAAAKMTDAERIEVATKIADRELSEGQKKAVLEAHEVGKAEGRGYRTQGGVAGEYTKADLKAKTKTLKDADLTMPEGSGNQAVAFSTSERRKMMELGIVGQNPATTLGRAEQSFIPNINAAMSRRNAELAETAASEGAKYYKSKAALAPADFKKTFPENDISGIVEANYFGMSTDDAAKLANRYLEVHEYNPEQGKLAIISRLRRESKYYKDSSARLDSNVTDYRVYRNKELEYKLTMEYYEARYPNKFNELDYEKLTPGQRQTLEKLHDEVKKQRDQAKKNKWPGFNATTTEY